MQTDRDEQYLVFCAGGGRFGTEAAQAARFQGTVLVADIDPQCQMRVVAPSVLSNLFSLQLNKREVQLIIGRAEAVLLDLMSLRVPNLVVPAIPGHFAAKVAQEYLKKRGMRMLPNTPLLIEAVNSLPREIIATVDEQSGVLITSHMPPGLMCKTPCVQNPVCPVTGKHKEPMNQMISQALEGSFSRVMVSRLLGEVGAIPGLDFTHLLNDLQKMEVGDSMALATSCQCHAIANFFITAPL